MDPNDIDPMTPEVFQMVPSEMDRYGSPGFFDEVRPERTLGPSHSRPPASSEAVASWEAEEDLAPPLPMRKDTVDRFLEQFDRNDVAEAVREASLELGEEPPMPPPTSPPPAEDPETYDHEFTIRIERELGTPLGINMGQDMKIAGFQAAGAVLTHNASTNDEELKVQIGDTIVGVNGARGDWKLLKKHLKEDATLEMVFARKKLIPKNVSRDVSRASRDVSRASRETPVSPISGPLLVDFAGAAAPSAEKAETEKELELVEHRSAAEEEDQGDQAPPPLERIDESPETGPEEHLEPPGGDVAIKVDDSPTPKNPLPYVEDPDASFLEKLTGRTKYWSQRGIAYLQEFGQPKVMSPEDEAWLKGCQEDDLEDLQGPCACVGWCSQKCLARGPLLCVLFGMLTISGIVAGGMVGMPPEIELDFSTFLKTDVNTSAMNDVFKFALQHKWDRRRLEEVDDGRRDVEDLDVSDESSSRSGRSLSGSQLYKHQDLAFSYEVVGGGRDLLNDKDIENILAFENELRQSHMWQKMCNMTDSVDSVLCMPGISMTNYLSPSLDIPGRDIIPKSLMFDGLGSSKLPSEVARALVMQPARREIAEIILPKKYLDDPTQKLTMVRSVYRFKWYCCTSLDTKAQQTKVLDEYKDVWNDFIDNTAFPLIKKYQNLTDGQISIFYRGNDISSKEIWSTLLGDLSFALGAALFVLFYLMWHTGRAVLGFVGLIIIMSSILISYVFVAVLTGTTKLSLASCLSIFIIIGLGSDVVFVYSDFWHASRSKRRGHASRLTWTLVHAGKASLATSATTAISFFANLVSVLKPLREFGFFMGLCIMIVWVQLTLLFLPLCLIDEIYLSGCHAVWSRCIGKCKTCLLRDPVIRTIVRCVSGRLPNSLDSIVKGLQRWRIVCFLLPLALVLGGLAWSILVVEIDVGVPNIFPAGHNQNRGKEVFEMFKDVSTVFPANWGPSTPSSVDVCTDQMFLDVDAGYNARDWAPAGCDYLFWCEANIEEQKSAPGTCNCWRKSSPVDQCRGRRTARVSARFAADRPLQSSEVRQQVGDYFDSLPGVSFDESRRGSMRSETGFAPLLTEEWERGVKETKVLQEVFAEVDRNDSAPDASCDWQEICFCGAYSCKVPSDWTKVLNPPFFSQMNATAGSRRLEEDGTTQEESFHDEAQSADHQSLVSASGDVTNQKMSFHYEDQGEEHQALVSSSSLREGSLGRRLWQGCPDVTINFQRKVTPSFQVTVDVIFGIEVKGGTSWLGQPDMENAWDFMEMHQVYQPWAQRNLLAFCNDMPENLRVVEKRCWIANFKCFLEAQKLRFPLQAMEFKQTVQRWLQNGEGFALTGLVPSKEYLWIRDGEIKASWFKFRADFDYNSATHTAIEYQLLWDNYLIQYNLQASIYGKGAWHSSSLWVRAEAQSALMWSTIATVAIILVLAWLGMLVFTGDPVLSCLVVVATLGVIFGLFWFIAVLMAWPIGPIEVIALIVFIGYAVTYSLHIAHRYGNSDAESWTEEGRIKGTSTRRYKRTAFALGSIGFAALGSAVTTCGCSVFLLFCTLTIFKKLGAVVLAVTLMSIFAALVPLPAGLLLVGPAYPGPLSISYFCNREAYVAQRRAAREKDKLEASLRKEEERKRKEEANKKRDEDKQKKIDAAAAQKLAKEIKTAEVSKAPPAAPTKAASVPSKAAFAAPPTKAAVAVPTKAAVATPPTKAAVAPQAAVVAKAEVPAKAPPLGSPRTAGVAAPAKAKVKAAAPKAKGQSQSLSGVASTPQVKSSLANAPKAKAKGAAASMVAAPNAGGSIVPPLALPLTKAGSITKAPAGSIVKAPAGSISKAPAGSIIKASAPMHGASLPADFSDAQEATPELSMPSNAQSSQSFDIGEELPLPKLGQ
eukprot:TRINITY_DN102399_c0_g1_i1.p1 TRINITY_DN102399_c0_g1~~TRINITY_DN102399_c0_g1_i1.p1  ORF type:complete len:2057 (+),score=335.66 TRINITY_DN102399_c0_g1_i1:535-6171(+)